ncbi:MAG: methyltransferase, partial [Bacteroidota bacterium]
MECLYSPHLKSESTNIILDSDESKHAKVLRLREHDHVLVSSGTGTLAKARIIEINQGIYTLSIEETRH